MATKVYPCIIAFTQDMKRIKGKAFRYHIRATSKTGSFTNSPLCGRKGFVGKPIGYVKLHDAAGIASLCFFCRNKSFD